MARNAGAVRHETPGRSLTLNRSDVRVIPAVESWRWGKVMRTYCSLVLIGGLMSMRPCSAASDHKKEEQESLKACAQLVLDGFRKIASTRDERFEGKVGEAAALCRGGQRALQFR